MTCLRLKGLFMLSFESVVGRCIQTLAATPRFSKRIKSIQWRRATTQLVIIELLHLLKDFDTLAVS